MQSTLWEAKNEDFNQTKDQGRVLDPHTES